MSKKITFFTHNFFQYVFQIFKTTNHKNQRNVNKINIVGVLFRFDAIYLVVLILLLRIVLLSF